MKKVFGILAVCGLLFAACGNNAETEATTDTTVVEEAVVEEVAPVADTTVVDSVAAETAEVVAE